jgi:hypothetical protein
MLISQFGYDEEREILISGKYTHWQNVIMLQWLKFLYFYNVMQN